MKVGEKPDKAEGVSPNKVEKLPQKNTLSNYFKKA